MRAAVCASFFALFLVFATAAFGALPKKGTTLVGVIKSSPFQMSIKSV